jgi:tetratricopeptide (TPR) repeat protein
MDYDIKDSNVLLGFIEWQRMRDTVYDFFNNENIMPDDLLLFYYSGHGIYDDGDLYLATSEMDPYIPSRRGFNFDELRRLMNDSISTSIVTILDCCSSGSANISKGHEVDAARLARSTIEGTNFQGEGRCILAASQEQGEAFALEENNHSVFTYYLLRALKGEIQGAFDSFGHLTTDSLSKCVYYAMMSLPPSKRPKQKPIRKMETSGDIVLAYNPQFAIKPTFKESAEDLQSIIDKCKQYFDKGEYENGLDYLNGIITRHSSSFDLWNYKGMAHAKLNQYQEAIRCFDKGIMLNPKVSSLWINKGEALSQLGKFEESVKNFDYALELEANNLLACYFKAKSLLKLQKYAGALECYDRVVGKVNDKILWNDRGVTLSNLGRYDEALANYDNALKLDPYDEISLNNKGLALYSLGKHSEAVNYFDRILVLNPNVRHVIINKYLALSKMGNKSDAEKCYDRARRIRPVDNEQEVYDSNGKLISG